MTIKKSVAVLFLVLASSACQAEEGCVGGDESAWKSPEEATAAAKALGHLNTTKVIIEDGCYEVITINADGKIVGVQFDPVTLALYKVEEPR